MLHIKFLISIFLLLFLYAIWYDSGSKHCLHALKSLYMLVMKSLFVLFKTEIKRLQKENDLTSKHMKHTHSKNDKGTSYNIWQNCCCFWGNLPFKRWRNICTWKENNWKVLKHRQENKWNEKREKNYYNFQIHVSVMFLFLELSVWINRRFL